MSRRVYGCVCSTDTHFILSLHSSIHELTHLYTHVHILTHPVITADKLVVHAVTRYSTYDDDYRQGVGCVSRL